MKDRIVYLDVVKGLAIFMVCIGHSNWVSPRGMTCPLVQWIYTFHMPLFMLMSGYFSKSLFALDVRQFAVKEFKRLLIPIIVFTGLKIGVMTLIGADVWRAELIGGMWFLRCLLFCDVIVYIGKKLCKYEWAVCMVSCLFLFVVPRGTFLRTNYFLLIYWTGYFWKKYYRLYQMNMLWITLMAFVLSAIIGITGEPQIIHFGEWQMLLQYYFAGIGWSFAIIGITCYVCRYVNAKWLAKVGMMTLSIYCVDSMLGGGLIKECVKWRCGIHFDWIWILSIGVCECFVCCNIVLLYRFLKRKCGCILQY